MAPFPGHSLEILNKIGQVEIFRLYRPTTTEKINGRYVSVVHIFYHVQIGHNEFNEFKMNVLMRTYDRRN